MKYYIQITFPEGTVSDQMPLTASEEANAIELAQKLAQNFEISRLQLFKEIEYYRSECIYEINSPTPSYSVVICATGDYAPLCRQMKVGHDLKKQSTAFNIAKTIMAIPETLITECLVYRNFGLETTQIKSFKKEDI